MEFLGWVKTFEGYYETQTRNILNNMLRFLQKTDEMRFVYAEMIYFERWWAEIGDEKREIVKGLVLLSHILIICFLIKKLLNLFFVLLKFYMLRSQIMLSKKHVQK